MKVKLETIKKQSAFCLDLMERLNDSIQSHEERSWYWHLEGHTQKETDVIRLRRELNALREMLSTQMEKNDEQT